MLEFVLLISNKEVSYYKISSNIMMDSSIVIAKDATQWRSVSLNRSPLLVTSIFPNCNVLK